MSIVLFVVESHGRGLLGEDERAAVVASTRRQCLGGVSGVGGSLRSCGIGRFFWRETDVL